MTVRFGAEYLPATSCSIPVQTIDLGAGLGETPDFVRHLIP